MPYYIEQGFFLKLKEMGLLENDQMLCRFQRLMLGAYYLTGSGSKRPYPPDPEGLIKSMADQLKSEGQTNLPYNQLAQALRRALVGGLKELQARRALWEADQAKGIREENSFAFFPADWEAVCKRLIGAGFPSVRSLANADEKSIRQIRGIGPKHLGQIMLALPDRERGLQPQLF